MGVKIWCVEDDASIRDIEVYALNSTGFEAAGFEDGKSFLEALGSCGGNGAGTGHSGGSASSAVSAEKPDLVVLDVMLPGIDGIELLKRLRASAEYRDIPIVMATAKGAEYDKIQGLDLGADYYLTKPFGVMEFVSCIKAVLRRCQPKEQGTILKAGALSLDVEAREVSAGGEKITLTYKEFELLKLFLTHPGTAFTRDMLFNKVWGMDYFGESRTVDMHIRTLRQKLGSCGDMIETVRGVGYKLEIKE